MSEEDIKIIKNNYVFTTNHVLDDENKQFKQAIENLINKNKELEIMINIMAEDIADDGFSGEVCRTFKGKERTWECDNDENCKNCILKYYEKKAQIKLKIIQGLEDYAKADTGEEVM